MQGADLIIRDGTVITMADADKGEARTGTSIVVTGNVIADIGPSERIAQDYVAKETIDARGKLVMPGLIDAHFHTAQLFFRGQYDYLRKKGELRQPTWKNYVIPFEGALSEDDVYLMAKAAYCNMVKMGTTCFAEAGGPHPDAMGQSALEVGLRGVVARSTVDQADDIPGTMVDTTEANMTKSVALVERWKRNGGGRVSASLAMRQIMMCTPELIKDLVTAAEGLDTFVHTHLAEGTYEIGYCLERFNRRPVEYLYEKGLLTRQIHAAHCVLLTDREVEMFAETGASIAHCPTNNFSKIGPTKVPYMRKAGVTLSIGTDGGTKGTIDLFHEMKVSVVSQLLTYGVPYDDTGVVSGYDMLKILLRGGANALHMDSEIGSIEKGKKADMLIINLDHFDLLPVYDPVFTAAKNMCGEHVDTVIVDGKVIMKGRRMLTIDEDALISEIKAKAPVIVSRYLEGK